MAWQEIAALSIVGITLFCFAAKSIRRKRRFSFEKDTHCGCPTPRTASNVPSIIVEGKRGEKQRIRVKN